MLNWTSLKPINKKPRRVLLARWMLLLGAAYFILYGSETPPPLWPHQAVAVLVLFVNCLLYGIFVRGDSSNRIRWLVTLADVMMVAIAIAIAGPSADFFMFFFLVMMLAGISHGIGSW